MSRRVYILFFWRGPVILVVMLSRSRVRAIATRMMEPITLPAPLAIPSNHPNPNPSRSTP